MTQANATASPEQALQVSRIIAIAFVAGVTIFATVTWFIQQENQPTVTPTSETLLYLFLGMTTLSVAAAVVLWRSHVAPYIESARRPTGTGADMDPLARAAALQTGLIICWALLEGPALLGVVAYFIDGKGLAGALGVLLIWIGIGATWPRREWFLGRADR